MSGRETQDQFRKPVFQRFTVSTLHVVTPNVFFCRPTEGLCGTSDQQSVSSPTESLGSTKASGDLHRMQSSVPDPKNLPGDKKQNDSVGAEKRAGCQRADAANVVALLDAGKKTGDFKHTTDNQRDDPDGTNDSDKQRYQNHSCKAVDRRGTHGPQTDQKNQTDPMETQVDL